jgi:hypothetical protein
VNKTSPYLESYIQLLLSYIGNDQIGIEAREAIIHALGCLKEHISTCPGIRNQMESLLMTYIYADLSSSNPILKARACWIYGEFGDFDF